MSDETVSPLDEVGENLGSGTQIAEEVFSVVDVLNRERGLRRALSDPGAEADARRALATRVFDSRISQQCVDLLDAAVSRKWTSPRAMTLGIERQGVRAVLRGAEEADRTATVADELFRIGRTVHGDPGLSVALGDLDRSVEDRRELLKGLIGDRVCEETLVLAGRAVTDPGRTFDQVIEEDLAEIARMRGRRRAVVTTAVALTDAQRTEMVAQLERITGARIDLCEVVEPSVLGGAHIDLGDEVIDSTVAHRLDQARRQLG